MLVYLQAFAPIAEEIWGSMPGDENESRTAAFDRVKALHEQLDAMAVPEDAEMMHRVFSLVALDVAGWFLYGEMFLNSNDYSYLDAMRTAGEEASYRFYSEYLPTRDRLLDRYDLTLEEVGFND